MLFSSVWVRPNDRRQEREAADCHAFCFSNTANTGNGRGCCGVSADSPRPGPEFFDQPDRRPIVNQKWAERRAGNVQLSRRQNRENDRERILSFFTEFAVARAGGQETVDRCGLCPRNL